MKLAAVAILAASLAGCASVDLERNKKNVVDFYEKGLNQKDFAAASKHFGATYIQHNPVAADGPEGFKGFVDFLKAKFPQSKSEIKRVFAAMEQQRPDAVLVSGEGDLYANRQLIAELAEKNRLPVMCPYRDYVEAGGLMAYAVDLAELLLEPSELVVRLGRLRVKSVDVDAHGALGQLAQRRLARFRDLALQVGQLRAQLCRARRAPTPSARPDRNGCLRPCAPRSSSRQRPRSPAARGCSTRRRRAGGRRGC